MNRKHIIDDIKHSLQKVSQIINLIENYDNSNAGVELDLLQKNITVLFENYVRLKMNYEHPENTHSKNIEQKEEPKSEKVKIQESIVESKVEKREKPGFGFNFNLGDDEGKINQNIESKTEKQERVQSNFNLEQAINEAMNIALDQTGVKPASQPLSDQKNEHHNTRQVINEERLKVKTEVDKEQSLNARFSSLKTDINLADKHLNNPISDLSKEISLNKKFTFVNELFDGNMESYTNAIQRLNTIGSMEYAHKYVNDLRATFKWDRENPIANEFIDLVDRRWEK